MQKQIIILTGPQGAGNHLFSKVLGLHPDVSGWGDILYNKVWSGHYEEPHIDIWYDVNSIDKLYWPGAFHIISISCPTFVRGKVLIPDYEIIINKLKEKGFIVKVAIIGRDKNILQFQQERVRNKQTLDIFFKNKSYIETLSPVYLSHELLFLYKTSYAISIYKQLGLPLIELSVFKEKINAFLKDNSNEKYIHKVTDIQTLDKEVKNAGRMSRGLSPLYITNNDNGC